MTSAAAPPAIHPPNRARRGYGHPWLTLVSVSFGLIMVGLDNTVVSVANPTIGRDLHASLGGLQWVTNAYMLSFAVLLVIGGKVGDRFGRKKVFLAGMFGFAAASLACGLSGSLEELIAFRAIQGVFGAMLMPQVLGTLRATFPASKLSQAVGVFAGVSAAAIAAGPIIGGILVQHVSWNSIFFVNLPVAALAMGLGLWVIRETRDLSNVRGWDLPGVLLLAGGLFAAVWAIIASESHGWSSAQTYGFLAGGVALLVTFVLRERTARPPLVPLSLFRSPTFSTGIIVLIAVMFAMFGVIFYITLYLQRVRGYSPVGAGLRMLPLTGIVAAAGPLGGAVVGRLGPRLPLFAAFVAISGSLAGLSRLGPHSPYVALWPYFLLIGLSMGTVQTGASQAVVGSAPRDLAGIAAGLQSTCVQVGGLLGTSVLGSVMTARVGAVLAGQLALHRVPAAVAAPLTQRAAAVAQGLVPVSVRTPAAVLHRASAASFASYCLALQAALLVAAGVTFVAAVLTITFLGRRSWTAAGAGQLSPGAV